MSLFDRTEAEELYANIIARREQHAREVGAQIDLDYATGVNYAAGQVRVQEVSREEHPNRSERRKAAQAGDRNRALDTAKG